ncbi:LacI family DNA-binding transcriptional regulator [Noviherbaspirillum sp. CPCC 100848]|uniref:LacI family DNA-binding transcriptional regulator n=1 Tax=Noviherbaspirillum album TaxID=3080276 RepID=A0ABU6J9X8_9BURK|nr:LacI family DNA-binding transcriptional regulator [Noviherbaspirillum sp. CPCC 100848]MEC4720115.1 LacI family DNA-binding transcriptional regulator [Noviherbaspirillum sp. CPCC 100848]
MPPKSIQRTPEQKAPAAKATIADVAREAGVSKATVSRFLNHGDKLLSADIASRVESAIASLRYTPSPMAQSLKRGKSGLIGLVVADVANPYSVAVLRGVETACREAGYLVILFNISNDREREQEAIAALSSYQVEGFILNTSGYMPSKSRKPDHYGKPAVLVDRRHADMQEDFVSLDNASAMAMAVDHLVEAGYRELLFVTQPLSNVSSRIERETAFRNCIAGRTSKVNGASHENAEDDAEALEQALRRLVKPGPGTRRSRRPAIITGNAVMTLRVAAVAARLGLQLGKDLGLIGFDDAEWAPLIGPGITTIAQPTDELGRMAARCLIERIEGFNLPPRQILLSGRLTARGSTMQE